MVGLDSTIEHAEKIYVASMCHCCSGSCRFHCLSSDVSCFKFDVLFHLDQG